jgi:hypothetical protein
MRDSSSAIEQRLNNDVLSPVICAIIGARASVEDSITNPLHMWDPRRNLDVLTIAFNSCTPTAVKSVLL